MLQQEYAPQGKVFSTKRLVTFIQYNRHSNMCAADLTYSRLWFAVEPSALIVYYV